MSDASNIEVVLKATGTEAYSVKMANAAKATQRLGLVSGQTGQALHSQVNDLQATSASLRLFEGRMDGSIRAAERFLTTIPGVGAALKAAFPLVGGIALASMFINLGNKVRDFIKQVNEMPNKLATGFSSLTDSLETSNDELAVTKDKLEKSIAILEHKPFNGLALALDESRVAADKLYESLRKDRMTMAQLADENGTNGFSGWFARNIEDKGDSRSLAGTINSYSDKISNLELKQREALHTGDTKAADNYTKQVRDTEQSAYTAMQSQISMRQGKTTVSNIDGTTRTIGYADQYGDQTSNINTATSFASMMLGRMNQQSLENSINKDTIRQTNDENANKQAEAAKLAAEALDRVSKQFASTLGRSRMKEYTRNYYTDHNLQQPAKELVTPTQELAAMAAIAGGLANPRGNPAFTSQMDKLGFKGSQISTANRFNYQRALVGMQSSTGQISPHEAALANASVNQQEYLAQMKVFSDQLSKINAITGNTLTQDQKDLQTQQILNAMAEAEGKRHVEVLQEQTDAMATTVRGGISSGGTGYLSQYTSSNIANNLVGSGFSNINNSLVSGMTTGHMNAAGMFRNISSSLGSNALGGIENKLFGGAFAKLGSSEDKAMWVRMVNHSALAHSSVMGTGTMAVSNLLGADGKTGSGTSSLASAFVTGGNILSKVLKFLPLAGFATGGVVSGGTPILVGEHGPEIFSPGAGGGYITPNHKLSSMSGGGQTINVDARGAVDPAATAVATQNAIARSAQTTAHNTIKAMHSARMNRPTGR